MTRSLIAKQRRVKFFADKVCSICGISSNLDLHHIDPATKIGSDIWSWDQARRDIEIAKCDILCHSCHGRIHGKSSKDRVYKPRKQRKVIEVDIVLPYSHYDSYLGPR